MSELSSNELANKQHRTDTYFGVCPVCGQTDGYMFERPRDPSDGASYGYHWHVCIAHKKKWCPSRLFSSYHYLSADTLERQYAQVETFEAVEGVYPEEEEFDAYAGGRPSPSWLLWARRLQNACGAAWRELRGLLAPNPESVDEDDFPF